MPQNARTLSRRRRRHATTVAPHADHYAAAVDVLSSRARRQVTFSARPTAVYHRVHLPFFPVSPSTSHTHPSIANQPKTIKNHLKTLDGGSLGSSVDEERGQPRELMRIAGLSEHRHLERTLRLRDPLSRGPVRSRGGKLHVLSLNDEKHLTVPARPTYYRAVETGTSKTLVSVSRFACGAVRCGAVRCGAVRCGADSERRLSIRESGCLGTQPKSGGKLHPRLNTGTSPIVDKYREGKLKRTLEREFKRT